MDWRMLMNHREILIRTEKLCKSFSQGKNQEHILKNLDVLIYKNDFTVIMGVSGSGKTTLLYMLSGMDKPSLGKVTFNEEDIAQYNQNKLALFRRNNCGFVFQQINLIDSMSVMDNIVACGLLKEKDKRKVLIRSREILTSVGITSQNWSKFPIQLSGGEAQRVGVARAAINNPEIIFADEPTGALNSKAGKAVLDLLSAIHINGQSIIMVTHDIHAALRGNRVIYLKDGLICGECSLGLYNPGDMERKGKLESFLTDMEW